MVWRAALLLWVMAGAAGPRAQDDGGPKADASVHTLHVYMDLIQVPVLVLDSYRERVKPIDPVRFLVSLDSGPVFHPRHVRQEGQDPITLGILLDATGDQAGIMPNMASAIASLAPGSLHANDHVTLMALDCVGTRTLDDAPADADVMKGAVDSALQPWLDRRKDKHAPCGKQLYLFDAMGYAVLGLAKHPGRRVLLVVTDGQDRGSKASWKDVTLLAQRAGVAVFALTPQPRARMFGTGTQLAMMETTAENFSRFGAVCESSGGVVVHLNGEPIERQLAMLVGMVRERYILEFTRARNETAGEHEIVVTVTNFAGYIRASGVSIAMPDPGVANDPTTIPREAKDAPELGTRRKLSTPR